MIKSFPSKNAALNNVRAIASFATSKGISFSPIKKSVDAKPISPTENAQRQARMAVKETFPRMLPAFQMLPSFATEFSKIEGNGVAICDTYDGRTFKDFFLVFDASIRYP